MCVLFLTAMDGLPSCTVRSVEICSVCIHWSGLTRAAALPDSGHWLVFVLAQRP
jgi:hypothetical protein